MRWSELKAIAEDLSIQVRDLCRSGSPFEASATAALVSTPLCERLNIEEALKALSEAGTLPTQRDPTSRFGDPPVTLWSADDLVVDLYFWTRPEPATHDHDFTGAFVVLEGQSLHLTWQFEPDALYSDNALMTGALERMDAEILRPGDCRTIRGGAAFIHTVAHLTRPSLSLTIRSRRAGRGHGLRLYRLPSISVHPPELLGETGRRHIELTRLLRELDHPRRDELVAQMLDAADDWHAFWLLDTHAGRTGDLSRVWAWLETLRPRRWFQDAMATLERERRSPFAPERLDKEGHRLLAMASTAGCDARIIERLVRKAFPETASRAAYATTLLSWIREMIALDNMPIELNHTAELALGAWIAGGTDRDATLSILRAYPDAPHDAVRRDVAAFKASATRFTLLRPFLQAD